MHCRVLELEVGHRNKEDPFESMTPCHDAKVIGLHLGLNSVPLATLAPESEDYTAAPQCLKNLRVVRVWIREQATK